LEYDPVSKNGTYAMMMFKGGKYHFYQGKQEADRIMEEELDYTAFMEYRLKSLNDPIIDVIKVEDLLEPKDSNAVDINNYKFEDEEVEFEKVIIQLDEEDDSLVAVKDSIAFKLPRQEIYSPNFTTDYVVSQVDNSFLNPSYQRYSFGGYQNPGFNGIMQLGLIDLFEDYRIIGGFRLPVSFDNSEYMLSVEDLKHRIDKKYMISRQAFQRQTGFDVQKIQTYDMKYNLKYPFSEVASMRLTLNGRYDNIVWKSTEPSTLLRDNENHYLAGAKLEYVFDNSRQLGLNLYNGNKFKIWGEAYHELDKANTDFFVLGFDYRHYQKVYRSIVFAI